MSSSKGSSRAGADKESTPVCDSNDQNRGQAPSAAQYAPVPKLLAVDCGLRTGLALFTLSGKLLWYRSHNLGNRQRLKRAAWQVMNEVDGLTHLVIEGGGDLAEVWRKEAVRRGLPTTQVQAEQWRKDLLLPRQQRSGKQAKEVADELAREVIETCGAVKPTALRHDAAEAILVGWWAIKSRQTDPAKKDGADCSPAP